MQITGTAKVAITCECGNKFDVGAVGLDTETDLVCPACGRVDHLDAEQAGRIKADLEAAIAKTATEAVSGKVNEMLAGLARGNKHIRYRPK